VLCLFYPSVKLPWMLGFFIRCGREQPPFCVEVKLEHTGSCILLGRRTYKDLHLGPSSACFSGCYQPPDRREGSKILVLDRRQVAHDVPSWKMTRILFDRYLFFGFFTSASTQWNRRTSVDKQRQRRANAQVGATRWWGVVGPR